MSAQPVHADDGTSMNAMRDLRDARKRLVSESASATLVWLLAIFAFINGCLFAHTPRASYENSLIWWGGVISMPFFAVIAIGASRRFMRSLCRYLEALVKAK